MPQPKKYEETDENIYLWLVEDLENAARNFFESKLGQANIDIERQDVERFLDGIVTITGKALFDEMKKVVADLKEAENEGAAKYAVYAGLVRQ